jgi:hypothetical protein
MRKLVALLGLAALIAVAAIPAAARSGRGHHGSHGQKNRCGSEHGGYETILDGSRSCFERWRYAGGASITPQPDGTVKTGPGAPGLGVLWYAARPYGDFSLKLQFRDDAPAADQRANSGVQVRFPAPHPPVPGCPTTFDGNEQNNAAWIAVNCGHEVQINDSPDGPPFDPRKTGSIYGFADLDAAHARIAPAKRWTRLAIRVVGQTYTVYRDGVRINRYVGSRRRSGYIGLQAHGAPQDVVAFRDIRIREL